MTRYRVVQPVGGDAILEGMYCVQRWVWWWPFWSRVDYTFGATPERAKERLMTEVLRSHRIGYVIASEEFTA